MCYSSTRNLHYRVVQLNFNPEIEVLYFICCLRYFFLILVGHLSNSIKDTLISGVKSNWTSLYREDFPSNRFFELSHRYVIPIHIQICIISAFPTRLQQRSRGLRRQLRLLIGRRGRSDSDLREQRFGR